MPASDSILVTGGAGFVGSHLVEELLESGSRVTVVDDFSTGDPRNLTNASNSFGDRLKVLEGRVSDVVPKLASEPPFDAVYHLAAAVGVRLVVERPIHTIETNIHETSVVLSYVASNSTPTLITSTSEVYGKGMNKPMAEDDSVVYGPTTVPRWAYAASKAIDEYLALAHHGSGGLPVAIVRLFNTVGPRQSGEFGMVLPRFVRSALDGAPIRVHGDGRQSRCFCDVRDVVPALIKLMDHRASKGRVINLGRDVPIEIGELARLVASTVGSGSEIVNVPYETVFDDRFEDLDARQPDLTRIKAAIGFEPKIPLETTIVDIASSMKSEAGRS